MPGTVAVITGGTTGIGAATRELLRERGARVYNLDVRHYGGPGDHFISCDVTTPRRHLSYKTGWLGDGRARRREAPPSPPSTVPLSCSSG